MLLMVLEWAVLVLIVLGVLTQIVVPAIRGTMYFPILNPRRRRLERALRQAKDREDQRTEECEILRLGGELPPPESQEKRG